MLWNIMDTIFMISENSRTSDPLLLNRSDKIDLKTSGVLVFHEILASNKHGRIQKCRTNLQII